MALDVWLLEKLSLWFLMLTSQVPVEGKSSVCVICMKYRIIISIIIIISLGQILSSYIANTSLATCAHTHVTANVVDGSLAPNRDAVNVHFWRVVGDQWPVAGSFNKQSRGRHSVREFLGVFPYKKIARPNWDATSWEEVLSVDTNSLRHLPRRSSQNCDLQFANSDRFKENYSIDFNCCTHDGLSHKFANSWETYSVHTGGWWSNRQHVSQG